MATAADRTTPADRTPRRRSIAQWFCIIVGATLVLVGLLGFIAEATFDTSSGSLDGDNLIIFEVNGWHNVVHLLSGAFLLAMAGRDRTARTAAIAFGAIYGVVTLIGLVDGEDVLGLLPVNPADNILHVLLSVTALLAGLLPDRRHDEIRSGGRFDRSRTASGTAERPRETIR